jgi:zinc protease
MKRFVALACLACTALRPALAKDPEIPFAEFHLSNGLRVIVHEDHKAPIVAVTVWYHVGSKNEKPGKTGFAHLFEHLMFNGSEHYNDEYFRPFEEVGATSMNGTTNSDRTNYFETVPTSALDLALWMESDRMGHLLGAIDQKKLDEQRGVVQNEKREDDNQPYGKVYAEIVANLFPPGHPYSWETIGSMEDLNAATLDDVKRWFQTYYGPNNATLVLAGDIDLATAQAKTQHFFGDIPPGPPLVVRERFIPDSVPASRVVMQDRVPQARIYKVWRGPEWRSDDTTLLELVDAVLTSGKSSRFYRRLVYDDQIATDVGAYPIDGEIAGGYVAYATAAEGQDLAAGGGARAAGRARARRRGRAFSARRADSCRARPRARRARGLVHTRHRASRRLPRQGEHPRRECGVRRSARLLQALARRDEGRHARRGARGRASLARGQRDRARSAAVPDHARRRQGGRRPQRAA